jgi:hypothetical protein
MENTSQNKNVTILRRALMILAAPVFITTLSTLAKMDNATAVDYVAKLEAISPGERVFQRDWGSAAPDVYARIAAAFNTEAMSGVELKRVECRSELCKVVYQAEPGIKVTRLLPRELADTFNRLITVHGKQALDTESLVYIEVPSSV